MWIGIISLFPKMFDAIIKYGVVGRAFKKGLLKIKIWNLRDFSNEKNKNIDKKPYGGGSGMLMMAQPLRKAIKIASQNEGLGAKIIYLSPKGKKINQINIDALSAYKKLILICGRYKGIDERIVLKDIHEEISIGDYILSGGELPAMVLIDALSRLIPGVISNPLSLQEDSFFNGLLECPYYTKPKILEGDKVPSILLSGDHKNIRRWKLKQSLGITWLKRPDLLEQASLSEEQINLLSEFLYEFYKK